MGSTAKSRRPRGAPRAAPLRAKSPQPLCAVDGGRGPAARIGPTTDLRSIAASAVVIPEAETTRRILPANHRRRGAKQVAIIVGIGVALALGAIAWKRSAGSSPSTERVIRLAPIHLRLPLQVQIPPPTLVLDPVVVRDGAPQYVTPRMLPNPQNSR